MSAIGGVQAIDFGGYILSLDTVTQRIMVNGAAYGGGSGITGPPGPVGSTVTGPKGDPGPAGSTVTGPPGTSGTTGAAGLNGVTLIRLMVAPRTYTNQGAGPTEASTADRAVVDLTSYQTTRFLAHVNLAGTSAVWKAQYSTNASAWTDVSATVSASSGLKVSSALALPAGAKQVVIVRTVAASGNGTEDPVVNAAFLEVT